MRTVPLDDQRADREAAEWFAKLNTLSISTRALEDFQSWRRVPGSISGLAASSSVKLRASNCHPRVCASGLRLACP